MWKKNVMKMILQKIILFQNESEKEDENSVGKSNDNDLADNNISSDNSEEIEKIM